MTYTVSITSQGQISIPVALRRLYGLDKTRKAFVYSSGKEIIIKPVGDFLSLRGVLKTRKKFSSKKLREEFGKYLSRRHLK